MLAEVGDYFVKVSICKEERERDFDLCEYCLPHCMVSRTKYCGRSACVRGKRFSKLSDFGGLYFVGRVGIVSVLGISCYPCKVSQKMKGQSVFFSCGSTLTTHKFDCFKQDEFANSA